ncbi:hypothetical protein ACWCXB_15085 [Streptomyces sp. NPDC001514]
MSVDTGESVDRRDAGRRAGVKTALGATAGVLTALVIIGIVWWQGWGSSFLFGWASVKVGAKVAVLAVAGMTAAAAWWRRRRGERKAGPDAQPDAGRPRTGTEPS